jgi:hypothetical protein
MKHLKTYVKFTDVHYKLFENSVSEEIKDYLKEIFLELEDDGFDIDIEGRWMRTEEFEELTGFVVKIRKIGFPIKTFLLEDAYVYILTCKSYLEENGFFITDIRGAVLDKYNKPETYGLDYGIGLHESNPEKYKLFNKSLTYLEFSIRKDKK